MKLDTNNSYIIYRINENNKKKKEKKEFNENLILNFAKLIDFSFY